MIGNPPQKPLNLLHRAAVNGDLERAAPLTGNLAARFEQPPVGGPMACAAPTPQLKHSHEPG